jgi:hypothetical protein
LFEKLKFYVKETNQLRVFPKSFGKAYVFKIIRKNTLPHHPTPGRGGGPGGWGRVFLLMILKTYPFFQNLLNRPGADFSKSSIFSFFKQPTFKQGRKLPCEL